MNEHRDWALEEFGKVEVSDVRNRRRLVDMGMRLARNPSGTVAGVFMDPAERQGAYDLLSNVSVSSEKVLASVARATIGRCRNREFAYVAVDGTGITLADPSHTKPLGSVGKRRFPTRGLYAVSALAVAPNGTPLGLLDVDLWAREESRQGQNRHERRKSGDTEMRHWNDVLETSKEALARHAPSIRPWFVMDRESDEARILDDVVRSGSNFTIRANQNRVVRHGKRCTKLFDAVRSTRRVARCVLALQRTPKRPARSAVVELRASRMTIQLPTYIEADRSRHVDVNVVEVLERARRPDRLHWVLLTNAPIDCADDIARVVRSYKTRWRIEEFHRTWKSGACGIEDIQLRTTDGIRKWAIMLGTVATRIERLKHLARTEPDAPATLELHEDEIRALILAKRQIKTRVEQVPDGIPTIAQAVQWIADLGGFAAHYKKGAKPGSTTIGRGLHDLAIWTAAIRFAREHPEEAGKLR